MRPFIFDHVELSRVTPSLDPRDISSIEDFLIDRIHKMLEKAKDKMEGKPDDLKQPLIRLKIENTGYSVIKSKRINDEFINLIANQ